jgi:FixJ family two-component response regulator
MFRHHGAVGNDWRLEAQFAGSTRPGKARRNGACCIRCLQRLHESGALALVEWAYEFVVAGLLNKQTAAELGNSEITIQVHRGQIMRKMAASSLADLVKMAGKLGIS